jgi:hypothetical protein
MKFTVLMERSAEQENQKQLKKNVPQIGNEENKEPLYSSRRFHEKMKALAYWDRF